MRSPSPAHSLPRLMIRLSGEMREQLGRAAKQAGRSLNAEILARLERSFEEKDALAEFRDQVSAHEQRLKHLEQDVDGLLQRAGLVTDVR